MNHLKISVFPLQKWIALLLLWCFFQLPCTAQSLYEQAGNLPITAYAAEEYGGNPIVSAAIQSKEGLMYFAAADGIYEYDGVSWRSLFQRNDAIQITSFTKDANGRIFYAGQDFGYLAVDPKGETQAVSLLPLIPKEFRSGFTAYEIHFLNGSILLRTANHIIRLELSDDLKLKSFKNWKAETNFGRIFVMNNGFYVSQADSGLYRLERNELQLIPNTAFLGKEPLTIMLPVIDNGGKSLLLGTSNTGFYLFDGSQCSKFPTEVDALLKDGNVLRRAISHQGNYILGFLGGGIITMNPKGKILQSIGTNQGLPSDVVTNIYIDQNNGLWVTTDDGMARIAIASPIRSYGKELGVKATVVSIEKKEEEIFLGTNTGVLQFDQRGKIFQSVPTINSGNVNNLLSDGADLIVAGVQLQLVRDGKAIVLEGLKNGSQALSLLIPKRNPNLLLVGATTGILVYQRGLSKEVPWQYLGNVSRVVGQQTQYIFEGKEGTIYAAGTGKLHVLQLGDNKLASIDLNSIKTICVEIPPQASYCLADGGFYIFFDQKMQKYSTQKRQLVPTDDYKAVEKDLFDFNQNKSGILWYESLSGKKYILKRDAAGKFIRDDNPNSIAPFLSFADFKDKDSIYWFGTPKGLIRYDPKKDKQTEKQFFTLIRRIETKSDTLPLPQYGRNKEIAAIESKDNSYRFEFAAPYFEDEIKTKYQTYLQGFDADWIDWSDNKFKEYTNLPSGSYTFRVRAQAYTGRISEEAVYSFVVLPPWYATWWAYLIYALLIGAAITIIVKWRSQKLKAENRLLENRVNERTAALEKSITDLKATQSQLIQSEKMASLGELTAGIAHEIQNPLNFVNNFSEVSTELLSEMKEELDKGNTADAKEIAVDVIQNLEKINHHGKRADAIVKGMLQHSRNSSGKKEPTDLNGLCDEYLRLSYHGLRAKDKSFNATIKTDFDESIGKINLIPQDFGRVILNLLTNAFYAVQEKQKSVATALTTFEKLSNLYEPTVPIATKKENDKIIITVTDNGNGIPQEIIDKIFQPFFTTKPTGKGTGLGLSMSYDIITKGHSGELNVTSVENEGTTFIITITI